MFPFCNRSDHLVMAARGAACASILANVLPVQLAPDRRAAGRQPLP